MTCSNCTKIHRVTGLTYTAGTSLVMTSTNSGNISSLDEYCFILPCSVNPATVVTGSPVKVYMTINGGNYPVQNKYGLPLYSNYVFRRKLYKAWFVTDPEDATNSWVQLSELPTCKCHA